MTSTARASEPPVFFRRRPRAGRRRDRGRDAGDASPAEVASGAILRLLRDEYGIDFSHSDVQAALEAGFDEHITKPPDIERLEQLLTGTRAASSDIRTAAG